MERDGARVRLAPALRARAAARAARPRPAGARLPGRRGWTRDARAARGRRSRPSATGGASDERARVRRSSRRIRARARAGAPAVPGGPARLPRRRRAGAAAATSSSASASASPTTARPSTASRAASSSDALAAACRERGARRLARPAGRAGRRRRASSSSRDDPPLSAARRSTRSTASLTGCALGDRRDRHDRARRRRALGPPRAHARARPTTSASSSAAQVVAGRPRRGRARSPRPPPTGGRSRSSPARRRPPTSSSTASRASTARARSIVVVPGDDLDLRAAHHDGQPRVEDRRVRGPDDVGRDERLLAVREDARQRAVVGALADGGVDRLDEVSCSSSTVRSTSDAVGTGTRTAKPCSLPASSGMTRPIALAAPVEVGTRLTAAQRARRYPCAARRAAAGRRCRRAPWSSRRGGSRTPRGAPSPPAPGSSSCTTRWR